jgi:hypothetical protein
MKIANEFWEPLSHIFNLTFLSGTIPDKLKIALVTPIYKANEKMNSKIIDQYLVLLVLQNYWKKSGIGD